MVTTNKHILNWVDEMAALCTPDKIVWIDGSDAQMEELRAQDYDGIVEKLMLSVQKLALQAK